LGYGQSVAEAAFGVAAWGLEEFHPVGCAYRRRFQQ
jgi:hypothetical protein